MAKSADLGATDEALVELPDSEFVRQIDLLLCKSDPEQSIPWPSAPMPSWAPVFRPRHILDIGAGTGCFTSAVLQVLGQWGCLEALERVVLLDQDQSLLPNSAKWKQRFQNSIRNKNHASANRKPAPLFDVELRRRKLEVTTDGADAQFVSDGEVSEERFDLVICAHLTYYFGDGSGLALVSAIQKLLKRGGLLWLVIRSAVSPIYTARGSALKSVGRLDPTPLHFSEVFDDIAAGSLPGLKLVERRDWGFLSSPSDDKREMATYFLMWRKMPSHMAPGYQAKAVRSLQGLEKPLFREMHYIFQAE